jgi:hypothetical protein
MAVGNVEGYTAVLIAPERNALMLIIWTKIEIAAPGPTTLACGVTSQLQDGTYFSTTNQPARLNMSPEYRVNRLRRAGPAHLAERHQEALNQSGAPTTIIRDDECARRILLAVKRRNFEWHIARGAWRPLTPNELARLGIADVDEA